MKISVFTGTVFGSITFAVLAHAYMTAHAAVEFTFTARAVPMDGVITAMTDEPKNITSISTDTPPYLSASDGVGTTSSGDLVASDTPE